MDSALGPWLALRESVDAASRSTNLTHAVTDAIATANPVRVLDLATGTGSNLRYLVDRLPGIDSRELHVHASSSFAPLEKIRLPQTLWKDRPRLCI